MGSSRVRVGNQKAVFSSKVIEVLSILNRNRCENAKQIEGIRLLDKPNTLSINIE